jgi:hypothetical protein
MLVVVIGAVPVARALCELSCAEHHPGSTSSGQAHHEYHHSNMSGTTDTSSTASVSADAQGCTHEVESQPVSLTAKLEIAAPDFAVHRVDPATAPASTVVFSSSVRVAGLTPVPIALRTPLRA